MENGKVCISTAVRYVYLEVEAGDQREFLHGELFGGLLVAVAVTALDLGRAAEVLGPRESTSTSQHSTSLRLSV